MSSVLYPTTTFDSITTCTDVGGNENEVIIKKQPVLYTRRWGMLFMFSLLTFSSSCAWITFAPITEPATIYWGTSNLSIHWLSMCYMACYIPFFPVAAFVVERFGLRVSLGVGAAINAGGLWIRYFGSPANMFPVLMVGQCITAIAQTFFLGSPARLAVLWFGVNERATATAVGVLANQLGTAIGFLLSTYCVTVPITNSSIGSFLFGEAAFCTVLFIITVIFFRDHPPSPPSVVAGNRQQPIEMSCSMDNMLSTSVEKNVNTVPVELSNNTSGVIVTDESTQSIVGYLWSLINLMKDIQFLFLACSYGILVGGYYALTTLLEEILKAYFILSPTSTDVGWMGFAFVTAGLLGSIACGYVLDRTKRFRSVTIVIYVLSVLSLAAFSLSVKFSGSSLVPAYITSALFGFFITGVIAVGFEYAAEISFPVSEATSSGVLNASAQLFGIVLINTVASIYSDNEDIKVLRADVANWTLTGFLGLGCILLCIIRAPLKRSLVENYCQGDVDAVEILKNDKSSVPTKTRI